jgi:hypothetical protein
MSRLRFLAVALALGAAACGNDTTTTPTPTTTVTVTDTFSGTLTTSGAASYAFTTAASGQVVATIATLAPDSTLVVGLSLGTWNGNACQIVITKDQATQSSYVVGQASSAGSLCVRIFDVGNVINPTTYDVQVNHP